MRNRNILLILLVAANLRLSLTAITPLFGQIQRTLGIGETYLSLTIMVPLILFAITPIFVKYLLQKYNFNNVMTGALVLLILATIIRPSGKASLLFGSALIGLAIAILNVVLPLMVRAKFKDDIQRITGYYSLTTSVVTAVGLLVAPMLANWLGWQITLQTFVIPAMLALWLWLIIKPNNANEHYIEITPTRTMTNPKIRVDRKLGFLIVFTALQSFIFYGLNTWLPTIFESTGVSEAISGLLMSILQLSGILATIIFLIIRKAKHNLYLAGILFAFGSYALFQHGLVLNMIAAVTLGISTSIVFTLSLLFIANSSADLAEVAANSSITMTFGYLFASLAPLSLNYVHQLFGQWNVTLLMIVVMEIGVIYFGMKLAND
ncbi:MFS transporter [Weissella muntiaci]|uniref:MFS transporter n=1 Tax=Weissella muntiaci TaxID=2508881 RepID=A0A6C2C4L9_9LACO|nr:MFS transporter [Weissella muntiaci]TYC48727.1 MFS transporter [Weissella muntiaci]